MSLATRPTSARLNDLMSAAAALAPSPRAGLPERAGAQVPVCFERFQGRARQIDRLLAPALE